jgi:hypothetical protein
LPLSASDLDADRVQFFRAIRGAPATVLLLLMIRGAAMTNRDICRFTGYSDKTVTDAMGLLDGLKLTQYNGRTNGWSLSSGMGQMPLPIHDVISEPAASARLTNSAPPAQAPGGSSSRELSTGNEPAASALLTNSGAPVSVQATAGGSLSDELSTGGAEIGKFPIYLGDLLLLLIWILVLLLVFLFSSSSRAAEIGKFPIYRCWLSTAMSGSRRGAWCWPASRRWCWPGGGRAGWRRSGWRTR